MNQSAQAVRLCDIRAILISRPEGLLGLPMLIRDNPGACDWRVFSTLAALDVARHLASELYPDDTAPSPGDPNMGDAIRISTTTQTMERLGREQQHLASTYEDEGAAGWEPPSPGAVGWSVRGTGPLDEGKAYRDCWHHHRGYRPIFTREEIRQCFSMVNVRGCGNVMGHGRRMPSNYKLSRPCSS